MAPAGRMLWLLLATTVVLVNARGIRGKQSIFRQDGQPAAAEWRAPHKHSNSKDNEGKESDHQTLLSTSSLPTTFPTPVPTASPTKSPSLPAVQTMSAEKQAACEAAAKGDVYTTQTSVTVRFLYELLSPDDRDPIEVASNVDKRIQTYLMDELVDCTYHHSPVGGVGPGEAFVDPVLKDSCSNLVAGDSEVCHLMAGSVVLYLLSNGESNSEDEIFDPVSEKLRLAFNGERRFLQTRFVDEGEGILGVYYVGDYVYKDTSSAPGEEEVLPVSSIESDSNDKSPSVSSASAIPVAVATSLLVACFIFVFIVIFVNKRVKSSKKRTRGVLLDENGDDKEWLKEETSNTGKYSLRFSVVDTSDESSYCTSVDSAVAANERVMEDFAGSIGSGSLSSDRFSDSRPVFVDPNSVTYYSKSKTVFSFERSYSVADTVEI